MYEFGDTTAEHDLAAAAKRGGQVQVTRTNAKRARLTPLTDTDADTLIRSVRARPAAAAPGPGRTHRPFLRRLR